jgi:hypothetical protein
MIKTYELCLATAGKQVPAGPDWIHEVKHDGYRMLVIRENHRAETPADRYPHWVLPVAGGVLATTLLVLWVTSSLWYFTNVRFGF